MGPVITRIISLEIDSQVSELVMSALNNKCPVSKDDIYNLLDKVAKQYVEDNNYSGKPE